MPQRRPSFLFYRFVAHYGTQIECLPPRSPELKGKVERKIPVVRQQFLSSYEFKDIEEANNKVIDWSVYDYGMQTHGTTQKRPYEVFKQEEQPELKALPAGKFDIPLWKEARIHPDHHIVFARSYYSMPTRYIGKKVWVRGGIFKVQIFYDEELVKTHNRSYKSGTWVTDEADYPPEKSRYLLKSISYYKKEGLKYGENVSRLVTKIMSEYGYRNLRKIQGIFRLGDKYGLEELDLTCKRCLFYGTYRMSTIRNILAKELYRLPLEEDTAQMTTINTDNNILFIRPQEYFVHTDRKEVL